MKIDSFVRAIADASTTVAEYEAQGLTFEEATEFVSKSVGIRRQLIVPSSIDAEDLGGLENWDLSNLEVGMLGFPDPPFDCDGGVCIGCVEADPLVVAQGGEVVVHELGTRQHLLWPVAKNVESMFDALVIAAKYYGQKPIDEIEPADFRLARSTAVECSIAAGGEKYLDFYRMLVGSEP